MESAVTVRAAASSTVGRARFQDPDVTAEGRPRASVRLEALKTLWFNTGTLCNIECRDCYIESSPRNDRLVYLTLAEVCGFLDEVASLGLPTEEIGFTGGEPFMNPALVGMLDETLRRGFRVLVLTNAMQPLQRPRVREALLALRERRDGELTFRVSLDHHTPERHEEERGPGTWPVALRGLKWLAENGFRVHVAGRTCWDEEEAAARAGYARLFKRERIPVNAADPAELVLFPDIDGPVEVPEITVDCWEILGKRPEEVMCASSRMIVKRKGSDRPAVVSCTLLPYDTRFELGSTLRESADVVKLNHPRCARFCVLGGGSCSV
ncbi:MAG: radical SAM protein [Gemmatimonadota bacterium]